MRNGRVTPRAVGQWPLLMEREEGDWNTPKVWIGILSDLRLLATTARRHDLSVPYEFAL